MRSSVRHRARAAVGAAAAVAATSAAEPALAQRPAAPTDTTRRARLTPPVSPRRAFISSLALPGLGQSRLRRPTTGAIFAGVEILAIAMIGKSAADLRAARSFAADSVPSSFPVDSLGRPIATIPRVVAPFTNELVRARRLHVEDWVAVLLFNHLISGAEAFVSAQLWDLPAQISARPTTRGGGVLAVSLAW